MKTSTIHLILNYSSKWSSWSNLPLKKDCKKCIMEHLSKGNRYMFPAFLVFIYYSQTISNLYLIKRTPFPKLKPQFFQKPCGLLTPRSLAVFFFYFLYHTPHNTAALDTMLQQEQRTVILRAEFVGGWSNIWDPEDPGVIFFLCHKILCSLGRVIPLLACTGTRNTAASLWLLRVLHSYRHWQRDILCQPKPADRKRTAASSGKQGKSWRLPFKTLCQRLPGARRTKNIILTSNHRVLLYILAGERLLHRLLWSCKKKNARPCVRRWGEQKAPPVLWEALGDVCKNHPVIISCSHSIPVALGRIFHLPAALLSLEPLGLPPLQCRVCSKTQLLSALINFQVCSLAKQLMCTLAPRPRRDPAVFSSSKKLVYSYPHCPVKANVIAFNITLMFWSFD